MWESSALKVQRIHLGATGRKDHEDIRILERGGMHSKPPRKKSTVGEYGLTVQEGWTTGALKYQGIVFWGLELLIFWMKWFLGNFYWLKS